MQSGQDEREEFRGICFRYTDDVEAYKISTGF